MYINEVLFQMYMISKKKFKVMIAHTLCQYSHIFNDRVIIELSVHAFLTPKG